MNENKPVHKETRDFGKFESAVYFEPDFDQYTEYRKYPDKNEGQWVYHATTRYDPRKMW